MAYSGKITFEGSYTARRVWSTLVRFIVDTGYWEIIAEGYQSSGIQSYDISEDITVTALDTWIDLETISVSDYQFSQDVTGELVGSGDGTTTHFAYTLNHSNDVASSIVVHYTIGGTAYTATDDGAGNITGTNCSGTIDYTTGALSLDFTIAPDNLTDITVDYSYYLAESSDYLIDARLGRIKFLSTSGNVSSGDVIHAQYTHKPQWFVYFSSGYSGNEKIYIGNEIYYDPDGVHARIIWKAYKYFQTGMSFGDTTLGNPRNDQCTALWQSNSNAWIFVSPQRVVLVVEINGYYSSCYVGFFNRFAMPHEYNYPLAVLTSETSGIDYASTSEYRHFLPDCRIINFMKEDNTWVNWSSHYGTSYFDGILLPVQVYYDGPPGPMIYYPPGAPRVLLPIYIYRGGNIYGELEGVYFCPGAVDVSESEITDEDGTVYITFEDVFRHAWYQFMAIKEA